MLCGRKINNEDTVTLFVMLLNAYFERDQDKRTLAGQGVARCPANIYNRDLRNKSLFLIFYKRQSVTSNVNVNLLML